MSENVNLWPLETNVRHESEQIKHIILRLVLLNCCNSSLNVIQIVFIVVFELSLKLLTWSNATKANNAMLFLPVVEVLSYYEEGGE